MFLWQTDNQEKSGLSVGIGAWDGGKCSGQQKTTLSRATHLGVNRICCQQIRQVLTMKYIQDARFPTGVQNCKTKSVEQ